MKKKFILRDNRILDRLLIYLKSEDFQKIRDDKIQQVTIEPFKEKKTAEQEAFFHVLCRELSKETGYTEGEIKHLVKCHVFGTRRIVVAGKAADVPVESSSLPREEYSMLIDGCYRVAAEAEILLPPPRYRE